jgi:C-terminal processing protease CtpA/Prc
MTRSAKWIALVALTLLVLAPLAVAGEGKDCEGHSAAAAKEMHAAKKCAYGTQDCLDHMTAKLKTGGWVGIELDKDETTGVMTIQRVIPGSPAEQAGLQVGDVLFALNGIEINEKNETALKAAKKDWKPGQNVNYTLKRDGRSVNANLTLASMPADVLAKFIGEHMLEHASTEVVASK